MTEYVQKQYFHGQHCLLAHHRAIYCFELQLKDDPKGPAKYKLNKILMLPMKLLHRSEEQHWTLAVTSPNLVIIGEHSFSLRNPSVKHPVAYS